MHKIAVENKVLVISGELNFTTVVELWNESLSLLGNLPELYFDFSKVLSSNSGGLVLMLEWARYAKQQNKPIHFQHIPAQLLSIIRVSGLEKILNVS